ncbi:HAMP domain-containing histidine kinase [Agromyces sp. ISL-38]|uniref:sensor histidine kinase n=1 Tax=Agromyces sp. ISL-38 TaxID=2819107 RepID=UPI001BE9B605|nr:HAMP domain-containing sensor histidine kinase [Agromyces sp. ISL-38]MBT2500182.1 HAMP domain-containing histidine kinase [Agromyces sp. ISL-38]
MMLRRLKIRTRITAGSVLIALALSAIGGFVIYDQVRRIVQHGESSVLHAIEAPYVTEIAGDPPVRVDAPGPGQLAAVVDPRGVVVVDSLPSALSALVEELIAGDGDLHTIRAGGADYLVRTTAVNGVDGAWHVIAARAAASQASVLDQIAALLVVVVVLINLGFGAASWIITSVALAPVARLRRSAHGLADRSGDELLPVGRADDEIAALARDLNALIERLRVALEHERQMISNASHELRTPLAILQAQLDLALTGEPSAERLVDDLAAARRTLARLSGLATSLLELSRLDAQVTPSSATWDELGAELADAVERCRRRFGDASVSIDYDLPASGGAGRVVHLSVADFGRVCENLVANAVAAAGDRPVHVELEWSLAADQATLLVGDDAGGMNPEFVPSAFERFTRGTGAPEGGSGLGLAIVSSIAAVAGGTVELQNDPGAGLTVIVRVPTTVTAGRSSARTPAEETTLAE